ncbi:MAG: GTP-binding protein, partial [Gemmatimonadota bacterium]
MAAAATVFETSNIRNVAVVGHGGSGKTTLTDAICYIAGTTNRKGDVAKGSALTDFTPEENAHGISINLAIGHAQW